jgi:hypothetical protein
MKVRFSLILAGMVAGITATSSHAGCDSSCPPGACRYESAGNKFYCTAVRGKAPGTGLTPRAVNSSNAAPKGPAANTARTAKPKQAAPTAIQSPRDVASGQATGRRQHKP